MDLIDHHDASVSDANATQSRGESDMMKVLVSDPLPDVGLEVLNDAADIDVDVRTGLKPEELKEIIGGYDGLILRSGTKVTAEVIEAADRLKIIGRAGVGVENIDVDAASKKGIVVMNTPGGNNVTTGEHTISLMLALARHIPQAVASLKSGKWSRQKFTGVEVCNKTLGVIGLGNVGRIVAERALGLRMKVLGYDPFIPAEAAARMGVESVSLDEIYRRSDFITVHVPLIDETRGLINRETIAKMKTGVRIINCARGGIVDENDLAEALKEGKVAGAALDVYVDEPPGPDHPLVQLDQVVTTPHLGASTDEAQLNVSIAVAEQVRDFLVDGVIRYAVNAPSVSQDLLRELQPYLTWREARQPARAVAGQVPGRDPDRGRRRGGAVRHRAHRLGGPEGRSQLRPGRYGQLRERAVHRAGARYPGDPIQERERPGLRQLHQGPHPRERPGDGDRGGALRRQQSPHRPDQRLLLRGRPRRPHPGLVQSRCSGSGGSHGFTAGRQRHQHRRAGAGREKVGGRAISFIRVDKPVPKEVLDKFRALPEVISTTAVKL